MFYIRLMPGIASGSFLPDSVFTLDNDIMPCYYSYIVKYRRMTKKDFQIIAEILAGVLYNMGSRIDNDHIDEAISYACDTLRQTNPRFDQDKFTKAVKDKI